LLTEGRRAFLRRVSGIERGAECARYEPLLSALADGEASAEDLALLRPHMQTCLSCREALREFRAMPERVASVVPPAALGERVQSAAELATGQKVAAVAASAAALAGGGTAIDEVANHQWPARAAQLEELPKELVADPAPPALPLGTPPDAAPDATSTPPAAPAPEQEPAAPPPDPANEFDPTGAPQPGSTSPPPAPTPPDGSIGVAGGAGGGGGSTGGGSAGGFEFAP
jgi:hypothetical protein